MTKLFLFTQKDYELTQKSN